VLAISSNFCFAEIEISSVSPSQSLLGEPLLLTITGKGFDNNTKIFITPENNSDIEILNDLSDAWAIEVSDDIAYIADGYAGLKIIDVRNPFHPIMIGATDTHDFASGVTVIGYTIYVADGSSGLQIIDASDLTDPKITDTVKLNSSVSGIKVSGNIVYLANGSAGLQIMNRHNPSQLLGVADTPGIAYDVAVNGNTAYIADDYSGLQIIDVSDVSNPFISDFLDLPDNVYGIAISEDIAYVSNDDSGIQVLDISNPTKPYKIATIQTDHRARGLTVVDDKLYIVGDQYLSVLSVANIEIEAYTNNLMKLTSVPLTFSGEYHLKLMFDSCRFIKKI
jgi:hypothetical protein